MSHELSPGSAEGGRSDRPGQALGRTVPTRASTGSSATNVCPLPLARRGSCRDRKLAPPLQRGTSAQQPRLLDPGRVQTAASTPSQPSRLPGMNGSKIPEQVMTRRCCSCSSASTERSARARPGNLHRRDQHDRPAVKTASTGRLQLKRILGLSSRPACLEGEEVRRVSGGGCHRISTTNGVGSEGVEKTLSH